MTEGERLARFAAELRWDDVPGAVRAKVVDHVIDIIGVICAGLDTPEGVSCQNAILDWGGAQQCTVIGRAWRLPAPTAAFLNAFHGRIHTFDDTYEVGPIHPGSTAFSAGFACAEKAGLSGSDFLAAVLAGYEVGIRVSMAVSPSHYLRGFQNTGTCNLFTAAAAAGRASRLDATALLGALGLAGESAGGLRQYQIDGSMADSAYSGARAALLGVTAAELRRNGIAGPRGILEGKWGFCRTMAETPDMSRLVENLGETYAFMGTSLKPYASCRYTHGPVFELLRLRKERNFGIDDIESVKIHAFRQSYEVSNRPNMTSSSDAVLSHQFSAAVALCTGDVKLSSFGSSWNNDPLPIQLARRIEVIHDPALDHHFPTRWPHRVEIILRSGEHLSAESPNPPGGLDQPLEQSAVHSKFLELARPVLGDDSAARVLAAVEDLERAEDLSQLTALLGSGGSEPSRAGRSTSAPRKLEQT